MVSGSCLPTSTSEFLMKAQLRITAAYNEAEIADRKSAINELEDRAHQLHEEWFDVFGWDTPVPIDEAHHNLVFAMTNIQSADRCRLHIETAREQLNMAEWVINCEQSEGNLKPSGE